MTLLLVRIQFTELLGNTTVPNFYLTTLTSIVVALSLRRARARARAGSGLDLQIDMANYLQFAS